MPDVIDQLVGIEPGSRLDHVRAARMQARDNAQASYDALFVTVDEGPMTREERFAVALFVAGIHRAKAEAAFYGEGLSGVSAKRAFSGSILAESLLTASDGPVGHFPPGPLSREDVAARPYRASPEMREVIGGRLASAFEHAHLLVFRPRDASPAALQALLDAGWSTTGIVTLSQLVAFLCFQLRVVAGLKVLAALPEAS